MNEQIKFVWSKETKTKQRFDAPEGSKVSGSIYIDKEVAGDRKEVTVTLS